MGISHSSPLHSPEEGWTEVSWWTSWRKAFRKRELRSTKAQRCERCSLRFCFIRLESKTNGSWGSQAYSRGCSTWGGAGRTPLRGEKSSCESHFLLAPHLSPVPDLPRMVISNLQFCLSPRMSRSPWDQETWLRCLCVPMALRTMTSERR